MSFYVTLPSNASLETFKNNTQSEYTTIINPPLVVGSNYEVALVEIIMGDSYYNNIGSIKIKNPYYIHFLNKIAVANEFRKEYINIDIDIHPYDTYTTFFENLSTSINKSLLEEEYTCRYRYYTERINKQTFVFVNNDKDNYVIHELPVRDFNTNEKTNEVITELETFLKDFKINFEIKDKKLLIKNPTSIQFFGPILDILNLKKVEYIGNLKKDLNQINLRVYSDVFVYTDIIYDQYVGNDMKPLLKIISLKQEKNSYIVNQPQYYPVNKTIIDSIKIKIENQNNKNIQFFSNFNKVITKLHFKIK